MTHRTTVWRTPQGYIWRCTCGDWDYGAEMSYRIASAGARRHRIMAKRRQRARMGP